MNRKNRILSILLILNLIWAVSYYSDIQPVFNQYCTSCHQGENFASGGLDLTSYEYLMSTLLISKTDVKIESPTQNKPVYQF